MCYRVLYLLILVKFLGFNLLVIVEVDNVIGCVFVEGIILVVVDFGGVRIIIIFFVLVIIWELVVVFIEVFINIFWVLVIGCCCLKSFCCVGVRKICFNICCFGGIIWIFCIWELCFCICVEVELVGLVFFGWIGCCWGRIFCGVIVCGICCKSCKFGWDFDCVRSNGSVFCREKCIV